jgi:hypothetical protein
MSGGVQQAIARIPAERGMVNAGAASVLWAAALGLEKAIRADSCGGETAASGFAPEWDALVGRWFGDGAPGIFASATFRYELGGRVLTRRGIARDAATGARHEDLMTIYPAADGRDAEAMYHDRDGHVIHYAATWSRDGRSLVMLSVPEPGSPRYRLTWRLADADTLATSLQIAAPDTEGFADHSGGILMRTGD